MKADGIIWYGSSAPLIRFVGFRGKLDHQLKLQSL